MSTDRVLGSEARVQFASRIPKALHRAIKTDAIATEVALQDWIVDAFEAHLKRVHAELRDAARASG
jgi:predicted HicB family RNase H-like nuclease